jgi:hypothetical protein
MVEQERPECPLDAALLATTYAGGGLDDWFLPSRDEMRELRRYWMRVRVGGFGEDWSGEEWVGSGTYWTSSLGSPDSAWTVSFAAEREETADESDEPWQFAAHAHVRPIRSFSGVKPARVAGEWRVGDVGPAGGRVIFDAGPGHEWGRYLEAAPKGWCGKATDPFAVWALDPDEDGLRLENGMGLGASNTQLLLGEAADPRAQPERLTALAMSEHVNIRSAVATNPATPITVLQALAADESEFVLAALCANPQCPKKVRRQLKDELFDSTPPPLAALLAATYTGGDVSDWFLPSRDELRHVYSFWARSGHLGLVKGSAYWSSSNEEGGAGQVRVLGDPFDDPWLDGHDLDEEDEVGRAIARVRPVRWFSTATG